MALKFWPPSPRTVLAHSSPLPTPCPLPPCSVPPRVPASNYSSSENHHAPAPPGSLLVRAPGVCPAFPRSQITRVCSCACLPLRSRSLSGLGYDSPPQVSGMLLAKISIPLHRRSRQTIHLNPFRAHRLSPGPARGRRGARPVSHSIHSLPLNTRANIWGSFGIY